MQGRSCIPYIVRYFIIESSLYNLPVCFQHKNLSTFSIKVATTYTHQLHTYTIYRAIHLMNSTNHSAGSDGLCCQRERSMYPSSFSEMAYTLTLFACSIGAKETDHWKDTTNPLRRFKKINKNYLYPSQ